jgi:CheY-like chemotaxis protein
MSEQKKVLIVDDSRVIHKMIRDMFSGVHIEILDAKDGIEGISLITQEKPTLILLDWLMSKQGGWETFQQIQAAPQLRKIPLVVMSGRKDEVTEKIPEPFEYFEFLKKPFTREELIQAIKSAHRKVAAAISSEDKILALERQITKMQGEINHLKRLTANILVFLKEKLE